jgi:NAD(P)-dependent dehydrogenase (short-subunit alcohol dehydrogenase family)
MELENQVVVITGGGSGIGAALADAAHAEGARHVVVADLDAAKANEVAARVNGTGVGIDVRDESAVVALVDRTLAAHGPIGLFASNAGYVTLGGVEDTNERVQQMWEVHVMAHLYAARAVLPSMVANGGGYLLNTASAAGLLSQLGSMSYAVTKHAAVALAEWLAISHHHQGVRVSVLCPQAVETSIGQNSPDSAKRLAGAPAVASLDGVMSAQHVAQVCIDAMRAERFHVLPHEEVKDYIVRKATDVDRWLGGMRRMQDRLYTPGQYPGDAIAKQ